MPLVYAGVVLLACPQGEQLSLDHEARWYSSYFFDPGDGIAGYWAKQTDGDVVITGEVFDWMTYPDIAGFLGSRSDAAANAISMARANRHVDLGRFQVFFVVLGLNRWVASDGGAAYRVPVDGHRFNTVTLRVGDPFDFVAHEAGHSIGLSHSFGSVLFQTVGEGPGGYGHPHCVMSAMSYGGLPGGGPFSPAPGLGDAPEYRSLGPGLNAVTAVGKGWLRADRFHTAEDPPREFTIRARHVGGRTSHSTPQAVEVLRPDGTNVVIEYRDRMGWDRGQDAPYLIVAQGRGAVGEAAYPGQFVGTYLGRVRFPVQLGGLGHVYNGDGYGIEVLSLSVTDGTVRIRLHPRRVGPFPLELDKRTAVRSTVVEDEGTTTWEPGEKLCVEGEHPFRLVRTDEMVTLTATYSGDVGPITGTWTVAGQPVVEGAQPMSVNAEVHVANAKLADVRSTERIELHCGVEELPGGSRLRFTAEPFDGYVRLEVRVTLIASVGSAEEWTTVELTSLAYDYGEQFERDRATCVARLDLGDDPEYEVLFPPDLWGSIPRPLHDDAIHYLKVLGRLRATDERGFAVAAADVPRLFHVSDVDLTIVAAADRMQLDAGAVNAPPPGPVLSGALVELHEQR